MAERVEKPSGGLPQSAQPEKIQQTPDPRPHAVELDAMRGIAVLGVAMAHISINWFLIQGQLPTPLFQVNVLDLLQLFGFFQIPLFFLLSGYLLTWTEEARKERRGSYSLLNYAKRRALRLVPAYYVAIALVVLLGPANPSFGNVVLHMTFLHGFFMAAPLQAGPFWTLTPEIAFYALLPLLILKLRKFSHRLAIFGFLLLVSLITRLVMVDALDFVPILSDLGRRLGTYPTTWLYLCVGGVLVRMMVERYTNSSLEPSRRLLQVASAMTVVPLALVLVFILLTVSYLGMAPQALVLSPAAMVIEALAILVFISAVLGSPILKPVLQWRPLGFVGTISYSLYLLHSLIIIVVITFLLPLIIALFTDQGPLAMWAAFATYTFISLGISGVVAYLSFRYIESPFMRIKPK